MALRTRLLIFLTLFGVAVLSNLFAMFYLANSLSTSLAVMETIRQRQLVAVQMNAHLRDAEAALYRFQINGEAGFKTQFSQQLLNFNNDLAAYGKLTSENEERLWVDKLKTNYQQADHIGNGLIKLYEQQTAGLQTFLSTQAQLNDLLVKNLGVNRADDIAYQATISMMQDASRTMLTAITGYLAAPEDSRRVQFTDSVIQFRQGLAQYRSINLTEIEKNWETQIILSFNQIENTGLEVISGRDLQQSLFANFSATVFDAGQQTIVGKIEPYEQAKLNSEQILLLKKVGTAVAASIIIPLLISILAIGFMLYLTRQINSSVSALLKGSERVAKGDFKTFVSLTGGDEFARIAFSFNNLTSGLFNREERLRALISRMTQIQDEERRLIGLDLHDGLTQIIISANMHLNTLKALSGSILDLESYQELDLSRSLIRQAIEEARKVISELRPSQIEDFGLVEGLRRYTIEVCETEKWEYILEMDTGEVNVNPPVDSAIFRIAQEALTNVRKHARTKKIYVALKTEDKNLTLQVQDWGMGFDQAAFHSESQHLGLFSMQERAELLGGQCQITSQPGAGTIVLIRIPLSSLVEKMQ